MITVKEASCCTNKIHNLPVQAGMAVGDKAAGDMAAGDREVQWDLGDTDLLDIVGNLCVRKKKN